LKDYELLLLFWSARRFVAGSTLTHTTAHARLLRPQLNPQDHFAVRAMVAC
jgi:hypothetical protein